MNVTVSPDAMSARLTSVTFGSLRISTRCTDVSGPVRSAMTAPSSTRVAPPLPRSTWMTRTEPLTRRIRPQLFTATISAGRLTGVTVGVGPEDDGSHATTRPVNRRVRTRHRTSPLQPRARSGSLTAGDHVDRARERDVGIAELLCRVRRRDYAYVAIALDVDVGMVVQLVGGLSDPADERDRVLPAPAAERLSERLALA